MKWKPGKRSGDLRDQRSSGSAGGGFPGGGLPGGVGSGGLPFPLPGGGKGGILTVIIIAIVYLVISKGGGCGNGFDLTDVVTPPQVGVPANGQGQDSVPGAADPEKEVVDFVSFVLDDNQEFWTQTLQQAGRQYDRAELVLYRGQTNSGCGAASSAVGPFYCPLDQTVYVDLSFFELLNKRFKAPGDFAQAYVLSHEIGHHLQQELGIERQVREASQSDPSQRNTLSVRLELQADCLAGVWARSTYDRGVLEQGDLEEGIAAASSVGDDRIQQQTEGRISPENFTHGSSEQRARWLRGGFDSGNLEACDTFSADPL